jgi:hypothetical protein
MWKLDPDCGFFVKKCWSIPVPDIGRAITAGIAGGNEFASSRLTNCPKRNSAPRFILL